MEDWLLVYRMSFIEENLHISAQYFFIWLYQCEREYFIMINTFIY